MDTYSTSPRENFQITKSHEDHMSNLPDCIISRILSQLRTEAAVATSVLSRNWRYKWTTIYNLYLFLKAKDDQDVRFQSFRSSVNRILIFNDPWRMHSVRLHLLRMDKICFKAQCSESRDMGSPN